MSPQIVSSSLGALRNAGSVFGLILAHGQEIIYQDAPFPTQTLEELSTTVDDIAYYFEQEGRHPDQLCFGFDGGSILIILQGQHRMLVFHHHADEVDFVGKAAKAFFKDYEMNLLAEEWLIGQQPETAEGGSHSTSGHRQATQRVAVRATQES